MRTYEKPEIYFEHFELAEYIAGNCKIIMTYAEGECAGDVVGGVTGLFTNQGKNGCTTNSNSEGYCLTGQPTSSDNPTFMS